MIAADPACDRGNSKLQYLFVNGRWFRDRSLGHAFQEAYRNLLMTDIENMGLALVQDPKTEFKTFWVLSLGTRH